jgi:hypothetical protein
MLDLDYVKKFLHIDNDYEDIIIQGLIDSSKQYIIDIVGYFDENLFVMNHCALQLIAYYYNQRGESGSNTDVPYIVTTMLQHLCFAYTKDEEESSSESPTEPSTEPSTEGETEPSTEGETTSGETTDGETTGENTEEETPPPTDGETP